LFNAWNVPLVEFLSVIPAYLDDFSPSGDGKAITMPYRSLPGKNENTIGCRTRLTANVTGKRARQLLTACCSRHSLLVKAREEGFESHSSASRRLIVLSGWPSTCSGSGLSTALKSGELRDTARVLRVAIK
jgi:hypothetical protein